MIPTYQRGPKTGSYSQEEGSSFGGPLTPQVKADFSLFLTLSPGRMVSATPSVVQAPTPPQSLLEILPATPCQEALLDLRGVGARTLPFNTPPQVALVDKNFAKHCSIPTCSFPLLSFLCSLLQSPVLPMYP